MKCLTSLAVALINATLLYSSDISVKIRVVVASMLLQSLGSNRVIVLYHNILELSHLNI